MRAKGYDLRPRFAYFKRCGRVTGQKTIDQTLDFALPEEFASLSGNTPQIVISYKCAQCGEINREYATKFRRGDADLDWRRFMAI